MARRQRSKLPWDVLYAGAAPCCAGLYQFTVRLPPTFPDGNAAVMAIVQGVATPEGPFLTVGRRQWGRRMRGSTGRQNNGVVLEVGVEPTWEVNPAGF